MILKVICGHYNKDYSMGNTYPTAGYLSGMGGHSFNYDKGTNYFSCLLKATVQCLLILFIKSNQIKIFNKF